MFSQVNQPGVISKYAEKLGMGRGLDFLLFMLGAYNNSMLLLYSMAVKIGLVLGTISPSQAEHYYFEIMHAVEAMVITAIKNLEPVQHLAQRFRAKDSFLYIGSGPAYATAALSAAKLFEQPHLNGVSQYVEEWAHLQFFFTRPDGIPVFVLTPPGPSRGRALEQIDGIKSLGGTVIAVCNVEDTEVQQVAQESLLVYGDLPEEFIPWVYGVTGQLFAVTLLDLKGQPPIPAPYSFKKMMEINFKQIYASKIITNLVDQEN
jgi:glucosamine 6-phosphate synthetase-like amidotransferase/phosphosugar isomerase protein